MAGLFFAIYYLASGETSLIDPRARDLIFGEEFRYIRFLAWVAFIVFTVRLFDTVLFDIIFSKRKVVIPLLLRQIISFGLYLSLLAVTISAIFQTDLRAALLSGTLVAAVLGLALQDTLGNLFSGISLHIEQTFDVGDVIHSGEYVGVVEGVNWRATRLRTFNNNIVVVPNSVIARERLEIYPRRNTNGRLVSVSASYEVPPARVIRVLQQAATNVEHVAIEPPVIARVAGFADSAIHYEIKYFTRSYHLRDVIDADVRRAVWYAMKRNGIPIPFPIRTLHRYEPPVIEADITIDQIAARLAAADILAPLSEDERRRIAEGTRVASYSRGETILAFGQAGDSMYVVHDGTVSVRVPSGDLFTEVAQLGAGSIFGEMALLTGESRTASIVAVTDVVAMKIQKGAMQAVLEENPELASALSSKIVERRSAAATAVSVEGEDQRSLLKRIRSYFGLAR